MIDVNGHGPNQKIAKIVLECHRKTGAETVTIRDIAKITDPLGLQMGETVLGISRRLSAVREIIERGMAEEEKPLPCHLVSRYFVVTRGCHAPKAKSAEKPGDFEEELKLCLPLKGNHNPTYGIRFVRNEDDPLFLMSLLCRLSRGNQLARKSLDRLIKSKEENSVSEVQAGRILYETDKQTGKYDEPMSRLLSKAQAVFWKYIGQTEIKKKEIA